MSETIESTIVPGAIEAAVQPDATFVPPAEQTPPTSETTGDQNPDTAAPKKRRGRPPKDPSKIREGVGAGTEKTAAKKNKYSMSDAAQMAQQLQGVHVLVAMMGGMPEMQLTDKEALMLAQSVVNVCNQYDLEIDGKTGAFIQLIGSAGIVYLPRALAIRNRKIAERAAAQNPAPSFPTEGMGFVQTPQN